MINLYCIWYFYNAPVSNNFTEIKYFYVVFYSYWINYLNNSINNNGHTLATKTRFVRKGHNKNFIIDMGGLFLGGVFTSTQSTCIPVKSGICCCFYVHWSVIIYSLYLTLRTIYILALQTAMATIDLMLRSPISTQWDFLSGHIIRCSLRIFN